MGARLRSGPDFARIRIKGKWVRQSLKTDVLTVAKLRLADLVRFLTYGGFRIGEVPYVTWADCDFQKGKIIVRGHPETGKKNTPTRASMPVQELGARPYAFTLIELLVVITIIAILASMLLRQPWQKPRSRPRASSASATAASSG